jgi:hypothetical protein
LLGNKGIMKNRIYYPYLATVVVFVAIYVLLEVEPDAFLHLGRVDYLLEGKMAVRIIQADIFTYGLVLLLLLVNACQILAVLKDDPSPRIYASTATVGVIYMLTNLLYLLVHRKAPSAYSFPAGSYSLLFGFATLVLLAVGLLVLDFMKFAVSKLYRKHKVR